MQQLDMEMAPKIGNSARFLNIEQQNIFVKHMCGKAKMFSQHSAVLSGFTVALVLVEKANALSTGTYAVIHVT